MLITQKKGNGEEIWVLFVVEDIPLLSCGKPSFYTVRALRLKIGNVRPPGADKIGS